MNLWTKEYSPKKPEDVVGQEKAMKQVEYVGEVLEDGDLSLPESVREELGLQPSAQVRVVISVPDADPEEVEDAWTVFRQMGRDAGPGQLADTAAEHDRYLYGKKNS